MNKSPLSREDRFLIKVGIAAVGVIIFILIWPKLNKPKLPSTQHQDWSWLTKNKATNPEPHSESLASKAEYDRTNPYSYRPQTLQPAARSDLPASPVAKINNSAFDKIVFFLGQHISKTALFDGNWRAQNSVSVKDRTEFRPFKRGFISWDTATGKIQGIILYLTLQGRPSPESDPYFTTEATLTKKFGPSDIRNLNLDLMAKDEGEWQLPRVGVSLKRIPHSDGQSESVDYELGVVAKDDDFAPKPLEGAFGYTLGTAMSQDVVRAARPQKAGGVILGVRALRPHVLLSEYALGMTPRTGRVYAIWGLFEGDVAQTVSAFKNLLKEARSNFDWDSCQYEKSSVAETLRLVKGDRSIAVAFKSGESVRVSASIRFLDEKILDEAVLESKGF